MTIQISCPACSLHKREEAQNATFQTEKWKQKLFSVAVTFWEDTLTEQRHYDCEDNGAGCPPLHYRLDPWGTAAERSRTREAARLTFTTTDCSFCSSLSFPHWSDWALSNHYPSNVSEGTMYSVVLRFISCSLVQLKRLSSCCTLIGATFTHSRGFTEQIYINSRFNTIFSRFF